VLRTLPRVSPQHDELLLQLDGVTDVAGGRPRGGRRKPPGCGVIHEHGGSEFLSLEDRPAQSEVVAGFVEGVRGGVVFAVGPQHEVVQVVEKVVGAEAGRPARCSRPTVGCCSAGTRPDGPPVIGPHRSMS
jgi:hypothetical protein